MIITWLVVVFIAAPLALTFSGALSGAGWEAQGSTAQQVRDEMRQDFPRLGAEDPVVVYHQSTPIAEDPAAFQSLVGELAARPRAQPSPTRCSSRRGRAGLPRRADRDRPGRAAVGSDADRPIAAGELGDYVGGLDAAGGARPR